MRASVTAARATCLVLVLAGVPALAGGQGAQPLRKSELVRLLSNSLISSNEVASAVRRNCLAFRPTERDWADLRSLGTPPEVVASIAGCSVRPAPLATVSGAPPATGIQVVLRQARVVAAAGAAVGIPVIAARGGIPQAGVRLVLRGSGALDGPTGRDLIVATDDSGFAVFELRGGRRPGVHHFEVAPATGGMLPGRPTVELVIHPGSPAAVLSEPSQILFDPGLDTLVTVAVTVHDSVGLPVAGEAVTLRAAVEDMGFPSDQGVTDSLGRARFVVTRGEVHRGGALQAWVRGVSRSTVVVALGAPLAGAGTGFQQPTVTRGAAGMTLGEPLVFEARTSLGTPAAGRAVSFHGVNAFVTPDSALTDSTGHVRVDVLLGQRVGSAAVIATIDSVEKPVTLQVDPGPAVALIMEHNGARVDGGRLVVAINTEFTLRVGLRDVYGNPTAVGTLGRLLRDNREQFARNLHLARLLIVTEEPAAVVLTFKAVNLGAVDLRISAGISAATRLEVVTGR